MNNKIDFMEWISIDDELPKINRRILVANANDKWVVAGHRMNSGLFYNQFEDKFTDADIQPTHWMPLPKPPKPPKPCTNQPQHH